MNAGTSLKLCKGQCESCNIDWKSILMEGIERCEQKIAGICLVCFKKGHSSDSLTDKCAGHCDTYPASTWSLDTERFWENGDGYA